MSCYTLLYTRRSSEEDDRQTLSLDAQEKECRAYAERQQLTISRSVRESHSARKPGRPLFEALLKEARERCRRGDRVRILCHKPDRLLRNLSDWARINDLMEAGVELLFVSGSYPNNAQGKMAFGVNVLFAKYYVDNLSEEVRKGLREKIARGEWPGPAPLGYRNWRDGTGAARIDIDPVTGPLVRRAFEHCASGEYSLATLAVKLEEEGLVGRIRGKRLGKSYLHHRVLTNPFYAGLMRYGGQIHRGAHPPLITPTLFEKVQTRLRTTSRPRRYRHEFRYGGIFRCARCGAAVIGDVKKGRYRYYRCSHKRGPCPEGYLREDRLELLIRQEVRRRVRLSPPVVEALTLAASRLAQEEDAAGRVALERQLRDIERKLASLLDLRLAGHLSDGEFAAKRAELVLAQAKAREAERTLELPSPDPQTTLNRFIATCNDPDAVFRYGRDGEIRTFLQIVGSNYRLGANRVHFEPVEPYTLAAQARNRSLWCAEADDVRKITSQMQALLPQLAPLLQLIEDARDIDSTV
jgi:site-specific DNA recombinase